MGNTLKVCQNPEQANQKGKEEANGPNADQRPAPELYMSMPFSEKLLPNNEYERKYYSAQELISPDPRLLNSEVDFAQKETTNLQLVDDGQVEDRDGYQTDAVPHNKLVSKPSYNFYSDVVSVNQKAPAAKNQSKNPKSNVLLSGDDLQSLRKINNPRDVLEEEAVVRKEDHFIADNHENIRRSSLVDQGKRHSNEKKPASFGDVIEGLVATKKQGSLPSQKSITELSQFPYTKNRVYRESKLDPVYRVIEFPNGDVYEGEIFDFQPNGYGWLRTSAFTYTGYFNENQFEGKGHIKYDNGEEFEGYFVKGLKEGEGVLKGADGQIKLKGGWSNGVFVDN